MPNVRHNKGAAADGGSRARTNDVGDAPPENPDDVRSPTHKSVVNSLPRGTLQQPTHFELSRSPSDRIDKLGIFNMTTKLRRHHGRGDMGLIRGESASTPYEAIESSTSSAGRCGCN